MQFGEGNGAFHLLEVSIFQEIYEHIWKTWKIINSPTHELLILLSIEGVRSFKKIFYHGFNPDSAPLYQALKTSEKI